MKNNLLNPSQTVYDNIKSRCKELDISLSDLCRVGGIPRERLQYWVKKNPNTVQTLVDVEKAFAKVVELKNKNK